MGTLYTSQSASNYNVSPPPDDGSQSASNQITWGTTIKAKLADPVKALADAINTQLTTVLDLSPRAISTNDSAIASDHWRTLQVTGTTTITLSDAATMTNKYVVGIINVGVGVVTIARATSGNTINGTAANFTVPVGSAIVLGVNQAANGYNIISSTGGNSNNTTVVATSGVDSGSTASLLFKTNNGSQTGGEVLNVASAVNWPAFRPAGTGSAPAVVASNSSSDGTADLRFGSKGAANFSFQTDFFSTGVEQVRITHTANATRAITLTGSNGGNPTIGTTAGNLAITPSLASLGGQASAGNLGVPVVVASGRSTAQVAAVASLASFTVGGSDASFEVSGNMRPTAGTGWSIQMTVSYTDEAGGGASNHIWFFNQANAITDTSTNAIGQVPFVGVPVHIRAKASTTITVATIGTFTNVTYNAEAIIKRTT